MLLTYSILWLKMVSYVEVNRWERELLGNRETYAPLTGIQYSSAGVGHTMSQFFTQPIQSLVKNENTKEPLVLYPDNLNFKGNLYL